MLGLGLSFFLPFFFVSTFHGDWADQLKAVGIEH